MSNSSLVSYTQISPNSNNPRSGKIKKITIHHMAGNLSLETCGNIFANKDRQASSNYAVGSDGRVGMYVEEKNRAWTSGSPENDQQAITIEVANDGGAPDWHVSDAALGRLIELCADICRRNGIEELLYTGDVNGNLTRHNMFQATACPGPYLQSKFPAIAEEVNARLAPAPAPAPVPAPTPPQAGFGEGDTVRFSGGPVYSNSGAAEAAASKGESLCKITIVATGLHPYHCISQDGKGVYGWVDAQNVTAAETPPPVPVPPPAQIAVGSRVQVRQGAKSYNGVSMAAFVYQRTYSVDELKGERAVLDVKGLCTAFRVSDLIPV